MKQRLNYEKYMQVTCGSETNSILPEVSKVRQTASYNVEAQTGVFLTMQIQQNLDIVGFVLIFLTIFIFVLFIQT